MTLALVNVLVRRTKHKDGPADDCATDDERLPLPSRLGLLRHVV